MDEDVYNAQLDDFLGMIPEEDTVCKLKGDLSGKCTKNFSSTTTCWSVASEWHAWHNQRYGSEHIHLANTATDDRNNYYNDDNSNNNYYNDDDNNNYDYTDNSNNYYYNDDDNNYYYNDTKH